MQNSHKTEDVSAAAVDDPWVMQGLASYDSRLYSELVYDDNASKVTSPYSFMKAQDFSR